MSCEAGFGATFTSDSHFLLVLGRGFVSQKFEGQRDRHYRASSSALDDFFEVRTLGAALADSAALVDTRFVGQAENCRSPTAAVSYRNIH